MKTLGSAVVEESFVVRKWHRKYFQKDYHPIGPVMTLEYARGLVDEDYVVTYLGVMRTSGLAVVELLAVRRWNRKHVQKDYLLLGPVMTLEYSRGLVDED